MPRYEYKVVPAPTKGLKTKGVKGAEARFAHGVEELMNRMSGDGWEYLRAETLPSVERAGLTGSTTQWRNLLVFRRLCERDADAFAPELLPAPTVAPEPAAKEPPVKAVTQAAEKSTATLPQDIERPADNGPPKTNTAAESSTLLQNRITVQNTDKSDA